MTRTYFKKTFLPEKVDALSSDQSTFLRTLREGSNYISFFDRKKLMLARESCQIEPFHMVCWIKQLRKSKLRLLVYFSDGRCFPLQGIRLNKGGCIRLLLPHPVIIKPTHLWFYANLYPEWSYFQFILDKNFPVKAIKETLERYTKASEPEAGEQPTKESEEQQKLLADFLSHYDHTSLRGIYLFFKHSPFNKLDPAWRSRKIKAGKKEFPNYIERKAKEMNKQRAGKK